MGFKLINEQGFGNDKTVQKYLSESNGMTVILLRDPNVQLFSYQTWIRVGSRHEKAGKTGIAHLFEHMMFKATKNHGEGEFDRIMEQRGGQTNAATWVDWTYYHEVLPATADNLETVVRLESDRLVNLVLTEGQLESEREVVINERRYRVDDDPEGTMYERLYDMALKGHPYGAPTIGWLEDIKAISVEDCLEFYRTYYAPNNIVVVLVGQFEADSALSLIDKHYGGIAAQEIVDEIEPKRPVIPSDSRLELSLPISTDRLLMSWISPSSLDELLPALQVGIEILFGGESSRLHRLLVLERELTLSIDGWTSHFHYPGLVEVSATVKKGAASAEVETLILKELELLAKEPPSQRELDKALNQFESGLYRSLSTANAKAGKLGHYEVTTGDYRNFKAAFDALRRVKAEDVSVAIDRVFQQAHSATLLARPADVQ